MASSASASGARAISCGLPRCSNFSLILGAVYSLAFGAVVVLEQSTPKGDDHRRLVRQRHGAAPPPPDADSSLGATHSLRAAANASSSHWTIATGSASAELLLRPAGRTNKYLSDSGAALSHRLLRPATADVARAARIRLVAAQHADGRTGWVMRVEARYQEPHRYVAIRAGSSAAAIVPLKPPGVLELRPTIEARYAVWHVPPRVLAYANATDGPTGRGVEAALQLLGSQPEEDTTSEYACLRVPPRQKPPSLNIELDASCRVTVGDEDASVASGQAALAFEVTLAEGEDESGGCAGGERGGDGDGDGSSMRGDAAAATDSPRYHRSGGGGGGEETLRVEGGDDEEGEDDDDEEEGAVSIVNATNTATAATATATAATATAANATAVNATATNATAPHLTAAAAMAADAADRRPRVVHVALGVAVRTHTATAPADLPLLKVFVPSLVATIRSPLPSAAARKRGTGCAGAAAVPPRVESYRYTLYLGYDRDDPTYDDPVSMAGVAAALRAALRGQPVRVVAVRYSGADVGAPCWVWNKLFARACTARPDSYFYQLNDDLHLSTPGWAPRFVEALRSSTPPNFGIAGPLDLNNERLMTQSFAHCTHYRALGTYYPWRFKNWYSDDWAAQLYAERTHWLTDMEVDHSLTKGPRYTISYEHARVVRPLVRSARGQLCAYLRKAWPADEAAQLFAPCAVGREGARGAQVKEEDDEDEDDEDEDGARARRALMARNKRAILARNSSRAERTAGARLRGATTSTTLEEKARRHARLTAAVAEWKAAAAIRSLMHDTSSTRSPLESKE